MKFNKYFKVTEPYLLCSIGLIICLLISCGETPDINSNTVFEEPEVNYHIPTDYVICVDNSGSIHRPDQQHLVRETMMLIIDLAEINDRVSVVTFGEASQIVANNDINSEQDREKLKSAVRSAVDFSESSSDFSAGLQIIVDKKAEVFRRQTHQVAILLK